MGLLLGDTHTGRDGGLAVRVWAAVPQVRHDRRRDRVESSPEQIAQSAQIAENMSQASGVPTRVVGWYHSHPHITVHPSHVDLRTQKMYQGMDEGFLGLILSVFQEEVASRLGKVQMTAFQTAPGGEEKRVGVTVVHPRSW